MKKGGNNFQSSIAKRGEANPLQSANAHKRERKYLPFSQDGTPTPADFRKDILSPLIYILSI